MQKIPEYRSWSGSEVSSDNGKTIQLTDVGTLQSSYTVGRTYTYPIAYTGYSGTVSSSTNVPTSAVSPGYTDTFSTNSKVGIFSGFSAPAVHARNRTRAITCYRMQPMYCLRSGQLYVSQYDRPTCEDIGILILCCSFCDSDQKMVEIPVLDHDWAETRRTLAT